MSNVWFTSDTHFNHVKVSALRGFAAPEKHDEHIVTIWNRYVSPGDVVWHLGDVGMGRLHKFRPTLERLNGDLRLVTGNHDEVAPGVNRKHWNRMSSWLEVFKSVSPFERVRLEGMQVLLSHYPYDGEGDRGLEERYSQYRLRDEGMPLLHGHTHRVRPVMDFSAGRGTPTVHVGWDAWERPVNSVEVRAFLNKVLGGC